MKSIAPVLNLFSPKLKIVDKEISLEPQRQTPYLKAILSATPSPLNAEKKINLTSPDLNAALRYIKESSMLKK